MSWEVDIGCVLLGVYSGGIPTIVRAFFCFTPSVVQSSLGWVVRFRVFFVCIEGVCKLMPVCPHCMRFVKVWGRQPPTVGGVLGPRARRREQGVRGGRQTLLAGVCDD